MIGSIRHTLLVMVCLFLIPAVSFAHHSVAGFFDPEKSVEIEGVVKAVKWRNPHTIFEVNVTNESGEVVTWHIESGALGVLRSRGLAREFVLPGDHVRIMGDASIRSGHEMFARNMLLRDGREVILTAGSRPYFSDESAGKILESEFDEEVIAAARQSAEGIFRVWSTDIDDRSSDRLKMFDGSYKLLDAAKAVRAAYDPGHQSLRGCTKWAMPRLMANPLPMEFVRSGENILQRFEEDDNIRVIHMNNERRPSSRQRTTLGFSTGHWEGDVLVVETSLIIPERFDDHGTPFSNELTLTERFILSDGGDRLDYTLTAIDPKTFAEPVERSRRWDWRPEIVVGAYNCEQDQELR